MSSGLLLSHRFLRREVVKRDHSAGRKEGGDEEEGREERYDINSSETEAQHMCFHPQHIREQQGQGLTGGQCA